MMQTNRGFTLIELLIAMAILAVAMGALLQSAAQNAFNMTNLRDRTIAQWVAANKLAELQTRKTWEDVGKRNGEMSMANSTWYWQTEVQRVNDDDLRRVEISVKKSPDDESSLYTLPGFLASPNVFVSEDSELQQ
ncbi:MAG: type II secretion system minor pseudopilin GspI [Gammaproteobacteria bacterium]|nr:type II secretion system minor pseudopilin GspI [Gammaproteobacteria bacterium]